MTKPRGLTLGTKLVLAMVVLVAAAVGTSAFYSLKTLYALADSQAEARQLEGEQAMNAQAELTVRSLVASAALAISEANTPYLQELAQKTLGENKAIEWIMIVDDQSDQAIARTEDAPEGKIAQDDLYKQLRDGGDKRTAEVIKVQDENDATHFLYGANARVQDTLVGRIRLSLSTRELQEAIAASVESAHQEARKSATNQLLFAGIILLVGVVIAVLYSRRIALPLHQLSVQAGYIAGGDFGQRVVVKSRDEIGQLAMNFNSMAESLGILLHEMAKKASMERELEVARSVQEMMSPPPKLLPVGDFSLTGRCEMAEQCGGDWWTYRLLSRNRLLVVVGDVTGHGVPAAMIAATARGAVEALAMVDEANLSPPRLLAAIDRAIRDVGNTRLLMTCFAVLLDPDKRKMNFANAGHTFPYVLRAGANGGQSELAVLAVRGNPLGDPNQCISADERELKPNDVLILSSDGLTDRVAMSGERFGEKRLRKILIEHHSESTEDNVATLTDRIVGQVNEFGGQAPLDDDMTLVICQFTGAKTAPQQKVA